MVSLTLVKEHVSGGEFGGRFCDEEWGTVGSSRSGVELSHRRSKVHGEGIQVCTPHAS